MNMDNMPMPGHGNMPMPGHMPMPGNMPMEAGLPQWVLLTLAVWFFAGACFYLYRLLFAKEVRAVYGYWDIENEIGHGVCMLGMVTMLTPMLLPIPFLAWAWLLGAGAVWFFVRAIFWGRKLSYNKWWWDWAHVAMLGGMALMFAGIMHPLLTLVAGAFWLWFGGYYAYQTYHDAKTGKPLYIGSDLAHMSMGVVMFLMTVAPGLFMGHMVM
jgi:hypothetical protein